MLERICSRVVVAERAEQVPPVVADLVEGGGTVDLMAVCSRGTARHILRDPRAVVALRRALSPCAVVWEEAFGETPQGRVASVLGVQGGSLTAWLTPAFGAVHTAAPGYSSVAAAWLRAQGLDRVTIGERALIDLRRRYRERMNPVPSATSRGAEPSSPGPARAHKVVAARRRTAGLVTSAGEVERMLRRESPRGRRVARLSGPGVGSGLPLYLRRAASTAGLDLTGHSWALVTPGDYENQKVLFFTFPAAATEPDLVVKLARSEAASARLERAAAALAALQRWPGLARGHVPSVAFSGQERSFAICAESAVPGVPFQRATDAGPACALVRDAVGWLTRLGSLSARAVAGSEVAQAMGTIVDRLEESYDLGASHLAMLRADCEEIAEASEIQAVFAHGDPGTWNLVARRGGGVAFLDWENAESSSPPLWDLFYLLRSYSTLAGLRRGSQDRHAAATSAYLRPGPLLPLLESSIASYCCEVDVPRSLARPLFHLCWAMHATRAAPRLRAWDREGGAHISFLRRMLDESTNPTLRRILGGPTP